MTEIASFSELPGGAAAGEPSFPPVKPRWLGPAATVAVALAHAGLAVFLMTVAIEKVTPLESVTMDLVPEGDMFESEQVDATDEVVPPEEMEQPDLAIPLPEVMTPDATPIPLKKEVEKKRVVVEQQAGRPSQGASRRAGASPDRHRRGTRNGQPVASRLQGAAGRRDPSPRAEQFVARRGIGVLQLPCVVRGRHDGHQLLGFVRRARFVAT